MVLTGHVHTGEATVMLKAKIGNQYGGQIHIMIPHSADTAHLLHIDDRQPEFLRYLLVNAARSRAGIDQGGAIFGVTNWPSYPALAVLQERYGDIAGWAAPS